MNPTYYSAVTSLINYIATSSTRHILVKSFGFGESDDVAITGNDLYPRVFLELPLIADYSNNAIEWQVVIITNDIELHERTNEKEKLSLAFDINNDLFQKFKSDGIYVIGDEFNSMCMTEFSDDLTTAWRTEFKFKQAIPMNRCNIYERFPCVYIGQPASAWTLTFDNVTGEPWIVPAYEGDTLHLFSSGGTSYSWTNNNGFTSTSQNPNIPNCTYSGNNGTYIVRVYDSEGCSTTASTFVTVIQTLQIIVLVNEPESFPGACDGRVIISSTGGVPAIFYDLDGMASVDGVYNNLCAATYTANATDDNGHYAAPLVITVG